MKNMIKLTFIAAISSLLIACGGSSSSSGGSSSAGVSSSQGTSSSSASSAPMFQNVSWMIPDAPVPTPHDVIPEGDRTFFISTEGSDSDPGTEEQPFGTFTRALNGVQAGDVIVVRGGLYSLDDTIRLITSGTADKYITIFAYPGEEPILDFTAQGIASNSHGIRLNGSYWHLYGLTIRNAGHNGIRTDGNYNRLERLVSHNNYDTGILLAATASHNLVMNCDSYRNFNSGVYTARVGNNADGFGVKEPNIGPGNHLYGNRAWENSDDGFDFWRAPNTIVLQNSWSFGNGDASIFGNPVGYDGGGNGFKLGGDNRPGNHVVIGNLAFDNFGTSGNGKGFDHNNNTGAFRLFHNTAFNNGRNFDFPNAPADTNNEHLFFNNVSIDGAVRIPDIRTTAEGNSWQFGAGVVTASMFVSVDTSEATAPRQADGSLPEIGLLRVAEGSPLKGIGVNIGLSNGAAPELGAYGYTKP